MAGRKPTWFNYEVSHENLWNHLSKNTEIQNLAKQGKISEIIQYLEREARTAISDPQHPLNHAIVQDKGFFKIAGVGGRNLNNALQIEQYNKFMEEGVDGIKAMLNNPQGLDILSKGGIVETVGTKGGKSDLFYRIGDKTVLKQSLKKGPAVLYASERAFRESLLASAEGLIKDPTQLNQALEEINTLTTQLAKTKGVASVEQRLLLPEFQSKLDAIFKKYPGLNRALNLREVGNVDNVLYIGGINSAVLTPDETIDHITKIRLRTSKGMSGGVNRQISAAGDFNPKNIPINPGIWHFDNTGASALIAQSFDNQSLLSGISRDIVSLDQTVTKGISDAFAKERMFSLTGGYNRIRNRMAAGFVGGLPLALAFDQPFREKVRNIDVTKPGSFVPAASHAAVDYAIGEAVYHGAVKPIQYGWGLLPGAVRSVLTKGSAIGLAASIGGSTPQGSQRWRSLGYKSESDYIEKMRTYMNTNPNFNPEKNYYDKDLVNMITDYDKKNKTKEEILPIKDPTKLTPGY